MNEIQIYSVIMFFAGVGLTHAVFYYDRLKKKKNFYLFLSSMILQALENVHLIHQASIEFVKDKTKTIDESDAEEYLEKEDLKLSVFMEMYVLLLVNSVPKEGRKYISYKSWPEAQSLLKKLRGFIKNEQSKR